MTDKPIEESYWVIPGSFLAGAYPVTSTVPNLARNDLDAFLEAGITDYFDLTNPGELPPYLTDLEQEAIRYSILINYQRHHIQDRGLPSRKEMIQLLDDLDASLNDQKKVYLHCWGGIGRTGTTIGCWLVRHGMSGKHALEHLNELYRTSGQSRFYPRSPETDGQRRFILEWIESGRDG
jgi:hypothetical protein